VPKGEAIIEPFIENEVPLIWQDEATQRLSRIPGFLQNMIKKRAEAYVIELGEQEVKAEHLSNLASKRFGQNMPFKKPPSLNSKSLNSSLNSSHNSGHESKH